MQMTITKTAELIPWAPVHYQETQTKAKPPPIPYSQRHRVHMVPIVRESLQEKKTTLKLASLICAIIS